MRSIRTSTILNIYLFFSVILDAPRSLTYAKTKELDTISTLFTTRIGVKIFLAIFEAKGKSSLLLPPYTDATPESQSGVYNRAFFCWQNSLFKKGFSTTLSIEDLFQLDKHLRSRYLHSLLQNAYEKGMPYPWPLRLPSNTITAVVGKKSLLMVTLGRLKWPILAVVPPRLCFTAFNFCQPFLINRAVTYSQQADGPQVRNVGYGLIGAYVIVYVGIAVRWSWT